MLKFLAVKNFALIDTLQVEFEPGLNLITGETGSGKSILVDAVSLLTGQRASQEMIRQGFDKASVEGIFHLPANSPVWSLMEASGIPVDDSELVVRRQLSRSGANKIFINGTLATVSLLSAAGNALADIHGQHDQQALLQARTHLEFLDAFGKHDDLLREVARLFNRYNGARERLHRIGADREERARRLETLQFQAAEIEKLHLEPGIDDELEERRRLLGSAERRLQLAQQSYQQLYESDSALLIQLDHVQRHLEELAELDPVFSATPGKLQEIHFQVEDLAVELRDYAQKVDFRPDRLERVQERLAEIQKLKRKYGGSLPAVLDHYQRVEQEIQDLTGEKTELGELEEKVAEYRSDYLQAARDLSGKRQSQCAELKQAVERELRQLAMENSLFEVDLASDESLSSEKGIDQAEFLISANPGEDPQALARIASGGELSRIILALKSLLTLEKYPKTLVFDEVDAGIGGRVASAVGERLARLARRHQIFCVTHLPQIACFAQQHFHVSKKKSEDRTVVQIRSLDAAQRIEELARMMAGDAVSDTTRTQARELMQRALP